MSVAVLGQVYDEVRRLAIAGSLVAPGDFRLKKLIPALQQAGKKSPVFARVAEATAALVDSSDGNSSAALLDLGTLINAILYTQGETGIEGKLEPIATHDFGLPSTQTSARVLKPLLEALTTVGAGRWEIIRDAEERGLFRDLRLIRPALFALDDNYGEIAEFIAGKVLPIYGHSILPELQAQFDPKGRGGQARRLALMHRIDPLATREFVTRALDEGSKEVRVAAISCLGSTAEDLPLLLEHAKAKAKDVRKAALRGLSCLPEQAAVKALCNAIEGADLELAVEALKSNCGAEVSSFLRQATDTQFQTLLAGTEKDKAKTGKQVQRMIWLLSCFHAREDGDAEQLLLSLFAQRDRVVAIKSEPGGKDLVEQLVLAMLSGSSKCQLSLVNSHASLPAECLGKAFEAAHRVLPADKVYSIFSSYLTTKVDEKKKTRDPHYVKREAIADVILHRQHRHLGWGAFYEPSGDAVDLVAGLDPRWLDCAIAINHQDLILRLARPGYAKSNAALHKLCDAMLADSRDVYGPLVLVRALIRVEHPNLVPFAVAAIAKAAKSKAVHSLYWFGQIITLLPKDQAVPALEALLPSLPEKAASQLIDFIVELKNQGRG